MTAIPPDPEPSKVPGLEPGGGVPPGMTPPDSSQTAGVTEPEPRPRHRYTPATIAGVIAVALFALLFITTAVVLALDVLGNGT